MIKRLGKVIQIGALMAGVPFVVIVSIPLYVITGKDYVDKYFEFCYNIIEP